MNVEDTLNIGIFALRLALALLMGGVIGLERQWRQRMAGTRTNALVAAGASAFVMSGFLIHGDPSGEARIVSYVVSGVGFLGAMQVKLASNAGARVIAI